MKLQRGQNIIIPLKGQDVFARILEVSKSAIKIKIRGTERTAIINPRKYKIQLDEDTSVVFTDEKLDTSKVLTEMISGTIEENKNYSTNPQIDGISLSSLGFNGLLTENEKKQDDISKIKHYLIECSNIANKYKNLKDLADNLKSLTKKF